MEYQVAMLWMRGALSYLERLCVQSTLDAGHHVRLYTYDEVTGVPDGVELCNATEILPETELIHERTGSPAPHADLFRYRLMAQSDRTIWADTDAYCRAPMRTYEGHLHGWESPGDINVGVLSLPQDSATLAALIEHTSDPYRVPPWLETRYRGVRGDPLRQAIENGEKLHAGQQPWGVWGPHALTHFLTETGEIRFTRPQVVLYPFGFKERREITQKFSPQVASRITEETVSIHFYGRRMRRNLLHSHQGIPPLDSFLGHLLLKHKIDPFDYPLGEPREAPSEQTKKEWRQAFGGKVHTATKAPARPLGRTVAVTTMKNEAPFILDWIAYHRAIGIDHFLVYTNDCEDNTNDLLDALAEEGLVTRVDNPVTAGERPQKVALAHAQQHPVLKSADSYIVMDVDEYINVHVGDGTLAALMQAAGDPDMISMTWRIFGCGGVVDYEDRPVTETFTRCAPRFTPRPLQAWGFKTLIRRPEPFGKVGIHRPLQPTGAMPKWTNGSGQLMPDRYLPEGWRSTQSTYGADLVTINHYMTRSIDSFLVKRDRGRTNHVGQDQGLEYWEVANRNEEEDTSIRPRLAAARAEREKLAANPKLAALHAEAVAWHKSKIAELRQRPEFEALRGTLNRDPLANRIALDSLPEAGPKPRITLNDDRPDRPRSTGGDMILLGEENEIAFQALLDRVEPRHPPLVPLAKPLPAEKIVVVSSMKNEGAFIIEWIAYHLSIGVTHFLIYTNDCDDPTNTILDRLQDMGFVTRLENPFNRESGQKPQRGALNDAATRDVVKDADWVGVIDVDEFVNLHDGIRTLPELFQRMNDPNVVSMTWKFFGSRGHETYRDAWQTETFVNCAPKYLPRPRLGWGFKSFIHRSAPFSKLGVHRPLELDPARLEDVRWVNGSGRTMPDKTVGNQAWFSRKASIGYGLVTLNHYVLRSAESFLVKRQRGRINHVDHDQGIGYWSNRNYATETDDSIKVHLPGAKKIAAKLMADKTLAALHAEAVAWHKGRIEVLMKEPDYRALYDAITDPNLKDAIYIAEMSAEGEGGEVNETEKVLAPAE